MRLLCEDESTINHLNRQLGQAFLSGFLTWLLCMLINFVGYVLWEERPRVGFEKWAKVRHLTYSITCGVSNLFYMWSLVAHDCCCKVVFKMCQSLVLVIRPIEVDHMCKMVLGKALLQLAACCGHFQCMYNLDLRMGPRIIPSCLQLELRWKNYKQSN